MDCNSTRLLYPETGSFSAIINDYIASAPQLKEFFAHPVSREGLAAAIGARRNHPTDRESLSSALLDQYSIFPDAGSVMTNILALRDENTYTICTAHQPVIFTGTLYFIYKILHAIKLAEYSKQQFPEFNFVPVYYMGCEDADLEELGQIFMGTEKLTWDTKQKGAVGRMSPQGLEALIDRIDGEITVLPYGKELVSLFKDVYLSSPNIQIATFRLIHTLFEEYGLVVVIPDNAILKKQMIPVFEDDLFRQVPSRIVTESIEALSRHYKVQANPREINLFYLRDNIRELISVNGNRYEVRNTDITFSPDEILAELHQYPERFSPNVILRGLFQETILPNLAFIGGGGETAYWLELYSLFRHYAVPFPMLVLRNSFLLIAGKWNMKMLKLGIPVKNIFLSADELLNIKVNELSRQQISIEAEIHRLETEYDRIRSIAGGADTSLLKHVEALKVKSVKLLQELSKKILRAEKRKFETEQRQISQLKAALFPLNSLQERIDNFIPWYSTYGHAFINTIYQHSPALEQQFTVIAEKIAVPVSD